MDNNGRVVVVCVIIFAVVASSARSEPIFRSARGLETPGELEAVGLHDFAMTQYPNGTVLWKNDKPFNVYLRKNPGQHLGSSFFLGNRTSMLHLVENDRLYQEVVTTTTTRTPLVLSSATSTDPSVSLSNSTESNCCIDLREDISLTRARCLHQQMYIEHLITDFNALNSTVDRMNRTARSGCCSDVQYDALLLRVSLLETELYNLEGMFRRFITKASSVTEAVPAKDASHLTTSTTERSVNSDDSRENIESSSRATRGDQSAVNG